MGDPPKHWPVGADTQWGCKAPQADVSVIALSEATNVTLFFNHGLRGTFTSIQLRQGCDANSALLGEYSHDGRAHLHVIGPGLYTIVNCTDSAAPLPAAWRTDPISTPPNPNTSCATALPMNSTEPYRNFDGSKLYFKFATGLGPLNTNVWGVSELDPGRMAAGRFHFLVQTACDDPSTIVHEGGGTFDATESGTGYPFDNLPPKTTYWVVFSEIDPGVKLRATLSTSQTTP